MALASKALFGARERLVTEPGVQPFVSKLSGARQFDNWQDCGRRTI